MEEIKFVEHKMNLNYFRLRNPMLTILKEAINVGLKLCSKAKKKICVFTVSCNNVAPVTNLCLGRATTQSHSSQWSKKKVAVET